MSKTVAFSSHVALINGKEYDGIGNVLHEMLQGLDVEYIFVRHSMDGLLTSEVRTYDQGAIKKRRRLGVVSRPSPLRYITELTSTVWHFMIRQKVNTYVGIDPLNALAGILLKKLGRVEKAIFYTPDYSPKRFGLPLLNTIYHKIDQYCVKNADEVWSVSSKIVDIRRNQGLAEEKNIFLPNVPPIEYNSFRKNKHDKYMLIMYGIVDKQLDFEGAIRAVKKLEKAMPKLEFTIVGNGPEEERLKEVAKSLKIEKRIHFKGRLPLPKTLEAASKAGIGLALYTGEWSFNQFGDSTKCREYFNYGLPVISTDTHATVQEIKDSGAGIIAEKSVEQYVVAIESVIEDYEKYSKASLKQGKKYEGIHRRLFLDLLR